VEPAVRPGTAEAPVAPAVGRVVSRRELFGRLGSAGRVTDVSAPPGSGKTMLLRSWIGKPGLAERAAWVGVPGGSVIHRGSGSRWPTRCRGTAAASALVRPFFAKTSP
jgi:LuxR family transcriptional regulator, maltose regulon positive regulatory protein